VIFHITYDKNDEMSVAVPREKWSRNDMLLL